MKKLVMLLVLFVLLFSLCGTVTFAQEDSTDKITLTEITDQERLNTFYDNVSIKVEEREPIKSSIYQFDVNEKGMIVLLHWSSLTADSQRYIRVLSSDGTFVKAFSYKNPGDVAIRWVGDNLQIFSIRGDIAFTMDLDGNILGVYDFLANDVWREYWNNELKAREKTVGEVTYKISSDDNEPLDTKIIVTSAEESKAIYSDNGVGAISFLVFGTVFVVLFIAMFIKAVIAVKEKY